MIHCVMSGAAGRMGRAIIRMMVEGPMSDRIRLSGALEHDKSEYLGRDAGETASTTRLDVPIVSDAAVALKDAHVVIDFSGPDNTLNLAEECAESGVALVVGTTGLTEEQKEKLFSYSSKIPMLLAPNMSVGVNLLFYLTEVAARLLGDAYDVEIVEAHHKHKKDAPSGTAQRLKEILLESLERDESSVVYGRHGLIGPRPEKEIGVHTVRGGDVVGDHTVYFFTEGERVELTHRASSRDTFASGAIPAAVHLAGAAPGIYSMRDILKL